MPATSQILAGSLRHVHQLLPRETVDKDNMSATSQILAGSLRHVNQLLPRETVDKDNCDILMHYREILLLNQPFPPHGFFRMNSSTMLSATRARIKGFNLHALWLWVRDRPGWWWWWWWWWWGSSKRGGSPAPFILVPPIPRRSGRMWT